MKLLDILFEFKKITTDRSVIFGVKHSNNSDIKKVMSYIMTNFSPDDMVVFSGEGGDARSNYPTNSEGDIVYSQLQKYFKNLINDSWDGKDFDVTNPNAPMYNVLQKVTGLPRHVVLGSIFASMVGQGQSANELISLLGENVAIWLRNLGIKKPTNPTREDIQKMYDLSFPQDTGGPQTDVSRVVDAYNRERDKNLIRIINKYESQGYRVIALVGESHIDLINAIN